MKNTRDRIHSFLNKYNWKTPEIQFTTSLYIIRSIHLTQTEYKK